MGGKEVLSTQKVTQYEGSDKRPSSHERQAPEVPLQRTENNHHGWVSPPAKVAKLKVGRQHTDSQNNIAKLAFFYYLERVETMRCFWELKHIQLEGGFEEDKPTCPLNPMELMG
ncbi:uncharacterized protein ACWYII_018866 [Salvelinus alpinus]